MKKTRSKHKKNYRKKKEIQYVKEEVFLSSIMMIIYGLIKMYLLIEIE